MKSIYSEKELLFLTRPAEGEQLDKAAALWGIKRRTYLNIYFFKIRESDSSVRDRIILVMLGSHYKKQSFIDKVKRLCKN